MPLEQRDINKGHEINYISTQWRCIEKLPVDIKWVNLIRIKNRPIVYRLGSLPKYYTLPQDVPMGEMSFFSMSIEMISVDCRLIYRERILSDILNSKKGTHG